MLGSTKSKRLVLIFLGMLLFLALGVVLLWNSMGPDLELPKNDNVSDLDHLNFTLEVDWKTLVDCGVGYSEFQRAFIDAVEKFRPRDAKEAREMVLWCWNTPYRLKSLAVVREKK